MGADLHGVDEHARESEGHRLRKLFAAHGDFEAVSKVDVKDLAGETMEHEV